MNKFLAILCFILPSLSGFASQEKYLGWQNVKITAKKDANLGEVTIEVETEGAHYRSVTITVFGKVHKLNKEDLDKLHGLPLESLRTTHEAGYESLGGRTLYLVFTKKEYERSTLISQRQGRITIPKNKPLNVSLMRKKV